ncbi:ribonuclease Oy-like [Tiliqua scincoides]|uniref:ribonuclease Oy-like n=1 Tax=Tiliqua scincoides TaxID=71010 RepID=UPI003462F4C2
MANPAAFFLAMGAFTALTVTRALVETEHSRSCPWSCLLFVQMWPGSFCVALGKKFECVMSKNTGNWTIHGLWPSNVMKCCPYWYLFPSDLVDLTSELNSHWPTFTNLTNFQFWENEWQKHGTCAGCAEALSSPNKYFRAALFLHTKYNIDRVLEGAAIVPSCKHGYQLSTLEAVLQPLLGDQHELQCVRDTWGRQVLVQVKASLHSNFSTGCIASTGRGASPYKPCGPQQSVFYFPASREHPRNPCPPGLRRPGQ